MQIDPLEEILEEERKPAKRQKQKKSAVRKKNGLAKFLLVITLLILVALGTVYTVQAYLDIEAEIQAFSIATAKAFTQPTEVIQVAPSMTPLPQTATPLPQTATPDAMLERTATISAQLTAVAEFQLTVTPNP